MEVSKRTISVPQPPVEQTGYDITGLTLDQAIMLRDIFGTFQYDSEVQPLYNEINKALGIFREPQWKVTVRGGTGRLLVLHLEKRKS